MRGIIADALWVGNRARMGHVPEKSIAVLPFVDMSEKHDQEYFSDGLSEELLDLLAKTQGLEVIARTSSFYFKGKQVTIAEIANTLHVAHLLEGSVRKAGRTMRGRNYVVGDRVTAADFVVAYTLDVAGEMELLGDCPALRSYIERMYARPRAPQRIRDIFRAMRAGE